MGEIARNPDGTFPAGVSGNPLGRPVSKKNEITELKQDLEIAIRKNVAPADISDIIHKMIKLARQGSVGAAKLILDKTMSNAKDAEEVKGESGDIRIIVENVTVGRERETIDAEDADYTELTEETDMSTGAPANQMKKNPAEGGGNQSGGVKPVDRKRVPSFQGKSGKPDNQSTNRGKGRA